MQTQADISLNDGEIEQDKQLNVLQRIFQTISTKFFAIINWLKLAAYNRRTRWEIIIICTLYASYASLISCRTSLDVSLPAMLDDKRHLGKGFNKGTASIMLGFATGSYFLGKPISGFFIDMLGGKFMLLTANIGITLMTSLFSIVGGLLAVILPSIIDFQDGTLVVIILTAIWCVNRFIMAAGWASVTSLVTTWFDQPRWGSVFGILSTSSRFGAVFATLVLGSWLKYVGWRGVFLTAAGINAAVVTWSLFMLVSSPKKLGLPSVKQLEAQRLKQLEEAEQEKQSLLSVNNNNNNSKDYSGEKVVKQAEEEEVQDNNEENHHNDNNEHSGEKKPVKVTHNHEKKLHVEQHFMENVGSLRALGYIFMSGRFWLVCISQMCFTVIFELNSFFPMYLKEVKKLSASEASTSSSVFGMGALSVLLFGVVYDRLFKVRFGRFIFMIILSVIATLCALILWLWQSLNIFTTMVVMFTLGFVSSPGFYLPMSVFSAQFGSKKHCAKISALIDFFAYSIAMFFDFLGGSIAEKYGWGAFFAIVVVAAITSIISGGLFQLLDYYNTFVKKTKVPQLCC